MAKLGYTWYPKDWGNSESVFELTLAERGLYRELIDMAMLNDNKTTYNPKIWARKFGTTEEKLEILCCNLMHLFLIEIKNNILFIPSCEPRLNLSRGGKKSKPTETSINNLKKPISKPISKQIEIESKKENKIEIKKEIENKNNIFLTELLNSQSWLESIAMNNQKKFTLIQVKEKLNTFAIDLDLKFDVKQNKNEFASHFVSWLNKQENTKAKPYNSWA